MQRDSVVEQWEGEGGGQTSKMPKTGFVAHLGCGGVRWGVGGCGAVRCTTGCAAGGLTMSKYKFEVTHLGCDKARVDAVKCRETRQG